MTDVLQSGRILRQYALEVLIGNPPTGQTAPMLQITGSAASAPMATLIAGIQTGTTAATALNNGVSQTCMEMIIENQPINNINILVGTAALQSFHIAPGDTLVLPIDNVNKVYVKTPSGSSVVGWLAVG